ncbi:MAG: CmcJ/NvfI family oxidoreductase [Proteobacteria bacterium]|nr:CmcJ/NvfI family oxidoreductase [Pseudomonadota bacterium]
MDSINIAALPKIETSMAYTRPLDGPAKIRVFPPSSGRETENPPRERVTVQVYDCRPIADQLTMDDAGFQLVSHRSAFNDFYNADLVERDYYPEAAALLKESLGAVAVYIFDHNVRNKPRSDAGVQGVRLPVDGAHNDYTMSSGPRRIREVLADNNASHLIKHRAALVNLWRPIVGPVQDHPLAICHAGSTKLDDFIPTEIQHFMEGNLEEPSLVGEIYSFKHSQDHQWFAVSDMQPDEVIFLKCFDTATDGRAIFTGHTGFLNPNCPAEFKPRESIELRTVVIFPEDA